MKFIKISIAASIAAMGFSVHAAEIKVGFITPLSGPISSQGLPFSKGIQAGLKHRAEVAGHKLVLIQLDDASDPSASARNARKLIEEDKVDVIIGTGGVPGAMAIAAVAREAKVPMVSFTPLELTGDAAAWSVTTAQPATLMVHAMVEHMKAAGHKTVGYIGFSDTWGDMAYGALKKDAEPTMQVVANERYARSDTSVAGQVLKVVAANPNAVITGTAGAPGALPYLGLAERGYKGALYGTHGLINPDFLRIAGASVEGLLLPTGPIVVVDQLPATHPSKKIAGEFKAAYQVANGAEAKDVFSAYAFDAWTVVTDAAARVPAKVQPGTPAYREALRDAIFQTKELAVTHGVLNYKPGTTYGADKRAVVVVKLEKGQWVLQK